LGHLIQLCLIREESRQLGGQIGMPTKDVFLSGRLTGVDGLQVRVQDFVQAIFLAAWLVALARHGSLQVMQVLAQILEAPV
jgi:hypothetical protein